MQLMATMFVFPVLAALSALMITNNVNYSTAERISLTAVFVGLAIAISGGFGFFEARRSLKQQAATQPNGSAIPQTTPAASLPASNGAASAKSGPPVLEKALVAAPASPTPPDLKSPLPIDSEGLDRTQKGTESRKNLVLPTIKVASNNQQGGITAGTVVFNTSPNIGTPDVTLRLVYSEFPALQLINISNALAREIKHTVALWNIDLFPGRTDPLPIPIGSFDYIRPHQKGGPLDLFRIPTVAPLLRKGNRVVGSISVQCPNCIRGRTFFVYIIWEESGWFSELTEISSGEVIIPKRFTQESISNYVAAIEAIPIASRIPITEP